MTPLVASCSPAELWHKRLGHLSYNTMKKMVWDHAVTGMNVTEAELQAMPGTCGTCVVAKHAADRHPVSDLRTD